MAIQQVERKLCPVLLSWYHGRRRRDYAGVQRVARLGRWSLSAPHRRSNTTKTSRRSPADAKLGACLLGMTLDPVPPHCASVLVVSGSAGCPLNSCVSAHLRPNYQAKERLMFRPHFTCAEKVADFDLRRFPPPDEMFASCSTYTLPPSSRHSHHESPFSL